MDRDGRVFEKFVMGAVFLGGVVALIFAFPYIGKSIREPLKLRERTFELPHEREAREFAELRVKDTDEDGLTDYDELYVWNTSPFILDSDSDGYDDKTEVESGNDPNCPRGKDCGRALVAPGTSAGVYAEGAAGVGESAPEDLFPGAGDGAAEDRGFEQLLGSLPAGEIRKLLEEQGLSKEILDQLDDAALVELYRQSLEEAFKQVEGQEQGQPSASQ